MKVTNLNEKQLNVAFRLRFCILIILGMLFVFPVEAVWEEPSQPAPQGNVARPLNIQTKFFSDNSLIQRSQYIDTTGDMKLFVKSCDPGEILMWTEDEEGKSGWNCQSVEITADNLLSVLTAGSDASSFVGDVYIGNATNTANLYLGGGELRAKWLHATELGDNTIAGDLLIGGLVGIGTNEPQAELDVIGNIKLGNPSENRVGMIFTGDSDGFNKVFAVDNETAEPDILAYWDWNNNFIFELGNVGIGITDPAAKLVVNGQSMFGSTKEVVTAEQNLIYGTIDGDSDGNLILLQKENDDRFKIDHRGVTTASDFCLADGSLCLSTGLVFVGRTTKTHGGNVGGYIGANDLCRTEISNPDPDNHVCTADEIIHLIRTNRFPTESDIYGWIVNGPPGYLANANDCGGWVESSGSYMGPVWQFNETGGRGNLTTCNVASYYPFLCCR